MQGASSTTNKKKQGAALIATPRTNANLNTNLSLFSDFLFLAVIS